MTSFLISSLNALTSSFDCLKPEVTFIYCIIFKIITKFILKEDILFSHRYKGFLLKMQRLEKCLSDLNLFCHNKLRTYLFT